MTRASKPLAGISLLESPDLLQAYYPLFENGRIAALESNIDVDARPNAPAWKASLLKLFADGGRLVGHSVRYPILAVDSKQTTTALLERFDLARRKNPYAMVSAHYGVTETTTYGALAPIPCPMSDALVEHAHDQLVRLQDACECPVGLENLALAFTLDDVKRQGEYLDRILERVDGYVLLDLHNLFCQVKNFDVPFDELLASYPLSRVREVHLSGGSESEHCGRRIRRDTHDGPVPGECLEMLATTLERAPNVRFAMLERMSGTVGDGGEEIRQSFEKMAAILDIDRDVRATSSVARKELPSQMGSEELAVFQENMMSFLEGESDADGSLAEADAAMVDVGRKLLSRWGRKRA